MKSNGLRLRDYLGLSCIILSLSFAWASLSYPQAVMGIFRLDAVSLQVSPLAIANGNVTKRTWIDRFGRNPDVDSGPEDVWAVGGTYTYLTAASTLRVVSDNANDTSAGTGARTGRLECLNASFNTVTETITLNGVTHVTSTNSCIRLQKFTVLTAGSGGGNAGIITIDSGAATPVLGQIAAGDNVTQLSHYTIPEDHTGYLDRFYMNAGLNDSAQVEIVVRETGGVFIPIRNVGLNENHIAPVLNFGVQALPARTDIKMVVRTVGGVNTDISGGYDLVLVED